MRTPSSNLAIESVEDLLAEFARLEQQLQEVRQGLSHSHRLATLGTIASIIAHEYNNILTPMINYAQLALAAPEDHELMAKAVEKSLAGAERAARISSSLLGFAREADEELAAPLRRTIDDAVGCMGREPEKDGIDLTIDVPDVRVAISPLNLQQVILNLLMNARKAMRHGGELRITGRTEGRFVALAIADTGPGIPAEIRDRLFEPFVTRRAGGDEAPGEARGTGLGLSICRDLMERAGGSITAESEPGRGATFHLTIPLASDLFETT